MIDRSDPRLKKAEDLYYNCEFDAAFDMFAALSEDGNAHAMYFLGEIYEHGYGHINADAEQAKLWRTKGCEGGDPLAVLESISYATEETNLLYGTALEEALELAKNGDVFAQYEIASYSYYVDKDFNKAMKWWLKSANTGFWGSMQQLGDQYHYGLIFDIDDSEAVKWYERGAARNYAESIKSLAWLYFNGDGVERDVNRALTLLKTAFEHGDVEAAIDIGDMSYWEADSEESFKWYKKAADLGNREGMNHLGDMYYYGIAVEANPQLAIKYYELAADAGDDGAANSLGKIALEGGDYSEAVKWFLKAAENDYSAAQYNLGKMYANGSGIVIDEQRAFDLYLKAAENSYPDAQYEVGCAYCYGEGVEENDDLAKEWFMKAAKNGVKEAEKMLHDVYGE